MPSNIFAKQAKENCIFNNEEYLYPEFLPERLPHRDVEIDEIASSLNPILKGKRPTNLFLTGGTGTGKTVTARFVLKQLEAYSDRAKSLYLNCFEFNTRNGILAETVSFLGAAMPRRGLSTDEIYSQLLESFKAIDFIPVLVLDEFDQLLLKNEASTLLYDLLRVIEYQKNYFGIILISNNPELPSLLDARVKSSLNFESLTFEQYTPIQLKSILKERVQHAFLPNTVPKEVTDLAAGFAAKNKGDARIAIEALLKAGRNAEKENKKTVSLEHLQTALDSIKSRFLMKSLPALDEHETLLLKILSEKEALVSGKLFKEYSSKHKKPLTERSYRLKLAHLQAMNLIQATEKEGIQGKTRLIQLLVPKEQVNELLKK